MVLIRKPAITAGHGPCLCKSSLKVWDDLATVNDVDIDADSY